MGNLLSFESLDDVNKERLTRDIFYSFVSLHNDHRESFEERIQSDHSSKTIHIDKVFRKDWFIRTGVSNDSTAISTFISDEFDDRVCADIIPGVTKIMGIAMDRLFGNFVANQSSTSTYVISVGRSGISRMDVNFFAYQFTSKKISEIATNLVAITVITSAPKLNELKRNDVSVISQMLCTADFADERRLAIRNKMWEIVQQKTSTYSDLHEVSGSEHRRNWKI
ncbi:hypothetical protein SERLA73DRAFT_178375 [Serpula lacrymans var. lacrymans S7.3]|uniref:Uncharacterized protein n=2 Tax=Serpula lacrymans var. lacrymans TaxID=341189 RepID=F8PTK8_SERL3|nr:uncharacterized protein SERLADRAFT_462783 [Serpula lacrymans var. lacrymans S7.9]EGO00536.1 hypothetical protein SERLA73DRAFT_178375 [Serpula lacrymans var. lacrymans S7.3]EGO26095.1 hypothetical protein SERLADRAFT_462783 [Serpula lacrymans var. lacrymans S7.9]